MLVEFIVPIGLAIMCTPFILCKEGNASGLAFIVFLGTLGIEFVMLCIGTGWQALGTKEEKGKKDPNYRKIQPTKNQLLISCWKKKKV